MNEPQPPRRIVTVDGIDGSGKSTLARRLAAALGDGAVLLGVDEFRRPVDWSGDEQSELDQYYEQRYDLPALERCLQDFQAGAPGCVLPLFDGSREALVGTREVSFAARQWLIVEGVFVGRLPSAARALSIFVDVPREEVRTRITRRDVAAGRALAEVNRRIDVRYFPAHDRYLAACDPRRRAAVLIDNARLDMPHLVRAQLPGGSGWQPLREALRSLGLGPPSEAG